MMNGLDVRQVEFPGPAAGSVGIGPAEPESAGAPKAPVRTILRFGIDIDGTISRAPGHFRRLIDALLDSGNSVYIITGRDAGRREETEDFLRSMGIRYTSMIMKPVAWPHAMADYKVEAVLAKDLHMMIDDEEPTCWAVESRTRALAVHMLPAPAVPEELGG